MITISDNNLKQLLRIALTAEYKTGNTRSNNQLRIAKQCAKKLMKRKDVQRIMNSYKTNIVADSQTKLQ